MSHVHLLRDNISFESSTAQPYLGFRGKAGAAKQGQRPLSYLRIYD
jgi:hypothetical protein